LRIIQLNITGGGNFFMIDILKQMIDEAEDKPKVKEILLEIAKMPENKQLDTLVLVEKIIKILK
jgi:hypothetical protein